MATRRTRHNKTFTGWGSRIRTSAYRSRICRPTTRRIPRMQSILSRFQNLRQASDGLSRALRRGSRRFVSQGSAEIYHLNCGYRSAVSVVATLTSGAIEGLLSILGGKNSEDCRFASGKSNLSDAFRGCSSDVFIVIRLASNHCSKTDDHVHI